MALGFKGGFAAFMDGANKAEAQNRANRRQDTEDAWLLSQREAKLAEQKRDEDLRTKLQDSSKDVTESVDQAGPGAELPRGGEAPMQPINRTRPQTNDELVSSAANVYKGAGNIAKYVELDAESKRIAQQRSSEAFRNIYANSAGKSSKDLVDQSVQIFNSDPGAGHLDNVRYGEDGSVSFTATNKRLGTSVQKTFKDPKQLLEDLHSYYSPDSYAKLQEKREASANKIAEEQSKPYDLQPGQQRRIGGRLISENTNESSAEKAARIRAAGQGMPGANGSKGGKLPLTGKDKALGAVEDKFKNDMDPSALTRVRNYVSSSYDLDPSIDDNQRVLAAEEASTNPASTSPRLVFGAQAGVASTHINATTGVKTPLYKMPAQYTPTPQEAAGFKSDVAEFVATENRSTPGFGDLMYNAARGDKTAAAALPDFVTGRVKERWMAAHPFPSNMPAAQKTQALAELDARVKRLAPSLMRDVGQSLNLIKMYGLK